MRNPRSDNYQWKFYEIAVPEEQLITFENSDSIKNRLNPFSYNERIFALEELLLAEIYKIVQSYCTKKQQTVVGLYLKGMTQQEIADHLNVVQATINKTLTGHPYNGKKACKQGKKTGGIFNKLRNAAMRNKNVVAILSELSELKTQ